MTDSGRLGAEGNRSTGFRQSDSTDSTSIEIFQRNESLAGFITDTVTLDDREFLYQHPHPVLLTSMPDDISLAVWTVILQIKKRAPSSADEAALVKKAKDLFESVSRPNRYYIGRGPECDVVLAPRSVSRRHAVLEFREGRWLMVDAGSTNGTRVNGGRLTPKHGIVLGPGASKLEFGADTLLWFLPPMAFLDYIKALKRQAPETPSDGIPLGNSMVITPVDPIKLPPKQEVTKTSIRVSPADKAKIAEAETNTMIRKNDEGLLGNDATITDEERVELPRSPLRYTGQSGASPPAPNLELRQEQEPIGLSAEPRLREAIKALAAMDSLISSVTVKLKNNPQPVTLSTSEDGDTAGDIADQLMTLGPKLKSVCVKLSVSDTPVEIYSVGSSRLGRVSDSSG